MIDVRKMWTDAGGRFHGPNVEHGYMEEAKLLPFLQSIVAPVARPISEYHEDMGPVLWWKFPVNEPPYVGGPLDIGFAVTVNVIPHTSNGKPLETEVNVGGWPGYHTHFTPIPLPEPPTRQ